MKGQSSAEMLILVGAILLVVAALVAMGGQSNESAVVLSAAHTGADNAIAALDAQYGCTIDIRAIGLSANNVTIHLTVRGGPPPDNQTIENAIRDGAQELVNRTGYKYNMYVEVVERVTK